MKPFAHWVQAQHHDDRNRRYGSLRGSDLIVVAD